MRASMLSLTLFLGLLTGLTPAAVDMYLPALPTIESELKGQPGQIQFTLALFFIGLVVGQLTMGPLADRWGRKPFLLIGSGLFVLASAGCALAGNIESLFAWRFVQGFGSCAGMVIARAMVRDLFPPMEGAKVLSLLMLVSGLAPILAPLLGGYMLLFTSWHGIFLFLTGMGILAFLSAWLGLPETRPANPAVSIRPDRVLRQYGAVLADRRFLGYALSAALPFSSMFAYIAGSPVVVIDLYGVPPSIYGWIFGSNAFGIIMASQINHALLGRFGLDRLLQAGILATAICDIALLICSLTGFGGLYALLALLFLSVAPIGLIAPNASAAAMAGHPERAGIASALLGILQFSGGALASSAVGFLYGGSALAMAGVMAFCGISGVAVYWLMVRPARAA